MDGGRSNTASLIASFFCRKSLMIFFLFLWRKNYKFHYFFPRSLDEISDIFLAIVRLNLLFFFFRDRSTKFSIFFAIVRRNSLLFSRSFDVICDCLAKFAVYSTIGYWNSWFIPASYWRNWGFFKNALRKLTILSWQTF